MRRRRHGDLRRSAPVHEAPSRRRAVNLGRANPAGDRPLCLFATVWSLRQYPSRKREWSWARKFDAMRAAGFDGVFAAPSPEMADRGNLKSLAGTSLDAREKVAPTLKLAKQLGAIAIDVQLGDYDTPLADAVRLA